MIKQELENWPTIKQYDYSKTFKDEANKSTQDALRRFAQLNSIQYPVSKKTLDSILSNMFYNKKKELKLSAEKKAERNAKRASYNRKTAVSIHINVLLYIPFFTIPNKFKL